MKGSNLGELEELVLLTVAVLFDNAYGLTIQQEIKLRCNRSATLSTIHAVLVRLEEKGYLDSKMDGAVPERGGRRKHLFKVTKLGYRVSSSQKEIRNELWKAIPKSAFA